MFEGCTIKYNSYTGTDEDDKLKTYNVSVQITYPNGLVKSVPMNNNSPRLVPSSCLPISMPLAISSKPEM